MIIKKNVGILLFDDVEVLDFAGPYEVFTSTRLSNKSIASIKNLPCPFNVFTFSERKKITASGDLIIQCKYTLKDCPQLNILLIPGGIGTRKLLDNKKILAWLKKNKNTDIVASICTGALLLAKAGLLIKKNATTHWGALNLLKEISPTTKVLKEQKYVFDTYYTSAGVSSGIDMSLYIIEKLFGKRIAKNTAKYIEYKY
jgi:transcriptional regulator GlxA family with amidase domain